MDFLSNLKKHDQDSSEQNKTDHHSSTNQSQTANHSSSNDQDHKPTNSELLNSCKIVGDAAKSHFGKQENPETKYDKHKVASAAATILDDAGDYGKLDKETGVGKYVEQAEEYLRKYGGGSGGHQGGNLPVGGGAGEHHGGNLPAGGGAGEHHGGGDLPEKKGHGEGGGGGDYMKMAQGFLHGKDDKTGGGGGGGSSDFMKMAGDFLKK